MNISAPKQMTLDFESGLVERYRSLKDVVATGVYQRGLSRVAIDLDTAPSNLSVQLSEDGSRHFSIDSLERYIEKTGDFTPIHYLAEKYLSDKSAKQEAAMSQVATLLAQMQPLLKAAGVR